jgi:hypothetical protein
LEDWRRFTAGSDLFLDREDSIASIIAIGVQNQRAAKSKTSDLREYKTACLFHTYGAGKTTMIRKMLSEVPTEYMLKLVETKLHGALSAEEKAALLKPALTIVLRGSSHMRWLAVLKSALTNSIKSGAAICRFPDTIESTVDVMSEILETQPVLLAFDEVGAIVDKSVRFREVFFFVANRFEV